MLFPARPFSFGRLAGSRNTAGSHLGVCKGFKTLGAHQTGRLVPDTSSRGYSARRGPLSSSLPCASIAPVRTSTSSLSHRERFPTHHFGAWRSWTPGSVKASGALPPTRSDRKLSTSEERHAGSPGGRIRDTCVGRFRPVQCRARIELPAGSSSAHGCIDHGRVGIASRSGGVD